MKLILCPRVPTRDLIKGKLQPIDSLEVPFWKLLKGKMQLMKKIENQSKNLSAILKKYLYGHRNHLQRVFFFAFSDTKHLKTCFQKKYIVGKYTITFGAFQIIFIIIIKEIIMGPMLDPWEICFCGLTLI